jgi:phosphoribosyl-ATP pyrophosphohydrolase
MADSIRRLFAGVRAARDKDPARSRTARLIRAGPRKIAKKVAEEAAEVALESAAGNRDEVICESADLIYHLVVLWSEAGVEPGDVWAEMDRREKLYGIAEKIQKTPIHKLPLSDATSTHVAPRLDRSRRRRAR